MGTPPPQAGMAPRQMGTALQQVGVPLQWGDPSSESNAGTRQMRGEC